MSMVVNGPIRHLNGPDIDQSGASSAHLLSSSLDFLTCFWMILILRAGSSLGSVLGSGSKRICLDLFLESLSGQNYCHPKRSPHQCHPGWR